MLETLIRVVELAGLTVGFLLAFRAGRSLARRAHDARLVKKYGRELPGGLGLIFYLLVLASLIVNITVLAVIKLLLTLLKLTIGVAMGNIAVVAYSLLVTLAGLGAGYTIYTLRYRGVEEPLTREGRIALRGVKTLLAAKRRVEEVKRVTEEASRRAREMIPKAPQPPNPRDIINRLLGERNENEEQDHPPQKA